jgi:hypothetical protein
MDTENRLLLIMSVIAAVALLTGCCLNLIEWQEYTDPQAVEVRAGT